MIGLRHTFCQTLAVHHDIKWLKTISKTAFQKIKLWKIWSNLISKSNNEKTGYSFSIIQCSSICALYRQGSAKCAALIWVNMLSSIVRYIHIPASFILTKPRNWSSLESSRMSAAQRSKERLPWGSFRYRKYINSFEACWNRLSTARTGRIAALSDQHQRKRRKKEANILYIYVFSSVVFASCESVLSFYW